MPRRSDMGDVTLTETPAVWTAHGHQVHSPDMRLTLCELIRKVLA